jgi:alpha-glucoside transport system permease protein
MNEPDALAAPAIQARPKTTSGRIVQALNRTPIHIALAVVALIWLAPTVGLLVTSFRPRGDIQSTGWWETLSTLRFTTENYEQVLNAQGMGQAFINNMIIAIPSTLLPLTLASMAAYAFS